MKYDNMTSFLNDETGSDRCLCFEFERIKHPKRQVYGYLTKQSFSHTPWEIELPRNS